jgi:Tfp pilus assembly protein PilV
MSNINFMKRIKKNEAGFTIVELLIASVMSVVVLGLLAHVFRSQQRAFDTQTGLSTMQANGRGAAEFVSRSVQNAGFNVKRGTRFLVASDHSLTAVYDEDNDNVIQNDEVITYTIANAWSGVANDTFSFVSWFDVNANGTISSTENPTINVQMTASGPPFNLYKVIPNPAGTGIERNIVARNIDNMVIRYYDSNDRLLPIMNDTDADGTGDVAFDADNDGVPDNGNWTFRFPTSELNDIRKVEIDMLARSRNPNPRETTSAGSYAQGSFAAVTSGSTAYNDKFFREDFTAQMAPRNLIMAPWGNIDIVSTPPTVNCPGTGSVLATLLDKNGEAVPSVSLTFVATGTGITLGSVTATTDSNGDRTTSVVFDYSSPFLTSTVSASAQVDDGSGNLRPVYNATPVGFTFGGSNFSDPFDGSQTIAWTDLVAGTGFNIPGGQEYFVSDQNNGHAGTLNGCAPWQDYVVRTNVGHGEPFISNDDFYGVILRHQDQSNYYWARITDPPGGPGTTNVTLQIGKRVAGADTTLTSILLSDPLAGSIVYDDTGATTYTLKAQIRGNQIDAKVWIPADVNDPDANEPVGWLSITDNDYAGGEFGLEAMDDGFQFDNTVLQNAPPII